MSDVSLLNFPYPIETVHLNLYKALTDKSQTIPANLALQHFQQANIAKANRLFTRCVIASITVLTAILSPLLYFNWGQNYSLIAKIYSKCPSRYLAIAVGIVFIAFAVLMRHLIVKENVLYNQIALSIQPETKLIKKLHKNLENVHTWPTTIDDAVKVFGKDMSEADRAILRTVFKQDANLLISPFDAAKQDSSISTLIAKIKKSNLIAQTLTNLKILAALKSYGLPLSSADQEDLKKRVANDKWVVNAIEKLSNANRGQ